ncbi:hypothetical protein AZOA_12070 [Azoarcus sp. Aa7]|nr:hypothetical protein [Azoarcus sp. Aa7]
MTGTTTGAIAEKILASKLVRICAPTRYIAGFRTASGRELALERERKTGVFLWTECVAVGIPARFEDVCEHYNAHSPRNSNLNGKNAPRLQLGSPASYWRLPPEALPDFLDWYCAL